MRILIHLVLIGIFLECLDQQRFAVSVQGLPFSIGKLLFIAVGCSCIPKARSNSMIVCFFAIYLCILISSLFRLDTAEDFSKAIGMALLLTGSIGWVELWYKTSYKRFIELFFILNFSYWIYYIASVVFEDGTLVSYNLIFAESSKIINHHVSGLAVSTSSIFILVRYFIQGSKIKKLGFIVILITLLMLVLSESRSNVLIYSLMILFIIKSVLKLKSKGILITGFIVFTFYGIFSFISEDKERLQQRFSDDREYQSRTNLSRIEIYRVFPTELISNPLGKGAVGGTKVADYFQINAHNQFFTFALQGGIVAFIFCIYFWFNIFRYSRKVFGKLSTVENYYAPLFAVSICYWLTLLTVDQGGLCFYVYLSLLFFMFDIKNNRRSFR